MLVVQPRRLGQWCAMLGCFVGACVAAYPLAYGLLRVSYRMDGFSAAQARAAIPMRELMWGGPGSGAQVWPLMMAAAALPLAGLVAPARCGCGRGFWWVVVVVLGAGVAGSVVVVCF